MKARSQKPMERMRERAWRLHMLFFELFPAFMMLVTIPVVIWLVAMDRQSRQRPIEDQTTQIRPRRPRS
jgi:hypothetical protein